MKALRFHLIGLPGWALTIQAFNLNAAMKRLALGEKRGRKFVRELWAERGLDAVQKKAHGFAVLDVRKDHGVGVELVTKNC
jgi:hypothetical protein